MKLDTRNHMQTALAVAVYKTTQSDMWFLSNFHSIFIKAHFLRSHTCTATIVIICISYRQYLPSVTHYSQPIPHFGNNFPGLLDTVQGLLSSHVITPAVSLSSDPFVCTKQFDYLKSPHTSWPIRARVAPKSTNNWTTSENFSNK